MFHSITSWVGVLPWPSEVPSLLDRFSFSLTFQFASRLTKFEVAFASGREIMSYTPYCVPATGEKFASTSVLLRTV